MQMSEYMKAEFRQMDPRLALLATARTYDGYEQQGKKPGSRKWEIDTRVARKQLLVDVLDAYLKLSLDDELIFPYHEDWVVHMWTGYRRMSPEDRRKFREFLEGGSFALVG